jgi:hypothetical protein
MRTNKSILSRRSIYALEQLNHDSDCSRAITGQGSTSCTIRKFQIVPTAWDDPQILAGIKTESVSFVKSRFLHHDFSKIQYRCYTRMPLSIIFIYDIITENLSG